MPNLFQSPLDVPALCVRRGWRTIAFVGVTKHAGKTTAMNAWIAQLAQSPPQSQSPQLAPPSPSQPSQSPSQPSPSPPSPPPSQPSQSQSLHGPLGILSIGLDGERLDTIMGIRKPPVDALVGTLVASAEGALAGSDAGFEYLEALPIHSPLGAVLVARVNRAGPVVLAGIRQRQHVRLAVEHLRHHGATWCLVDGAFDRLAAAAPGLVDAAVLAVGATAGRTVDDVVAAAAPFVQRFLLPETRPDLKEQLQPARGAGRLGALGEQGLVSWAGSTAITALAQPTTWSNAPQVGRPESAATVFGDAASHQPTWPDAPQAVYLPGAVTTGFLQGLLARAGDGGVELVVAHPAQLLAERAAVAAWLRRGNAISAWETMPLAAIAVNPHSATGPDLPRLALMEAVAALAPGVPVFDALAQAEVTAR